jgi:hypothetical protein
MSELDALSVQEQVQNAQVKRDDALPPFFLPLFSKSSVQLKLTGVVLLVLFRTFNLVQMAVRDFVMVNLMC